ncbi:MAG: DUF2235 domain-containing protein [Leptolyngbya sp. SIO1E4]|nr:DUF2235 domain-containing protein [Leptolyngbya sp. SIO1E4]
MKRLIVCCDGTWQKLDSPYPTNVVKLAQAIKPLDKAGIQQVVYYSAGVGTGGGLDTLLGGGLGKGIDKNIEDAYLFLCLNYVPGDEIYLFGFSRGAYTVRSLAGLIYNAGLLARSHIRKAPAAYTLYRSRGNGPHEPTAVEFRQKYGEHVPITLLGCWDTVGSLGIPDVNPWIKLDSRINQKYRFHDTQLNRMIQHALHAVAIDETRKVFDVTPMQPSRHAENQVVRQVWFPGDHGSVGGGMGDLRGLSDAALQWVIESIANLGLGLDFDPALIEDGILIDPTIPLNLARKTLIGKLTSLAGSFLREVSDNFEDIHEVAIQRFLKRADYKPKNLLQKHRSRLKV